MAKDETAALQEAHELLSEVRTLKDSGMREKTAINRLYYACFHATKAVLYDRGYDPKTHRGVKALLGKELQQTGEITTADVSFFNRMSGDRDTADYEYFPFSADVDELFERTEEYVETMTELLNEDTDDA